MEPNSTLPGRQERDWGRHPGFEGEGQGELCRLPALQHPTNPINPCVKR